jgi:hypothetical protein
MCSLQQSCAAYLSAASCASPLLQDQEDEEQEDEEGEEAEDDDDEEEGSDDAAAAGNGSHSRAQRRKRDRRAGQRRGEVEIVKLPRRTNKATLQARERLDGAEVLPNTKPMMELEAGSNVWYQAYVLKESINEAKIRFPGGLLVLVVRRTVLQRCSEGTVEHNVTCR